jgi:hypothetical protein
MADGRWPMADGRWPMADGRWPMADGEHLASDTTEASPVVQGLAQRGGDLRKVREENGGIEREAADRLQGDLDSVLGRIAKPHHAPGGLTDPVILGQVASGLPHQPYRRPLSTLSRERAQEQFLRPDATGHRLQTDFSPRSDVHPVPSC